MQERRQSTQLVTSTDHEVFKIGNTDNISDHTTSIFNTGRGGPGENRGSVIESQDGNSYPVKQIHTILESYE